jgi:hypothetical protein
MFQVRVMSVKDYGFAVDLANGMNWNMVVGDFRFSQFLEPEGCFVLCDDSVPVGMATCVGFGGVGWFGNFVVKSECRGRGGGSLLLDYAVGFLRGRGVETVGLYAYSYLEAFYGRFGFKTDLGLTVMYASNFSSVLLGVFGGEFCVDVSVVSCFDGKFFGVDRSMLLSGILQGESNFCYVYRENSDVVGYVLVKMGEGGGGVVEVGPLVCCPGRVDVAISLLRAALSRLSGRDVLVYLPDGQGDIEAFLLGEGFRKDFSLLRMFLGKPLFQSGVYLAESLERG